MSEAAKIVPFGKYKGQPLEQMAQDREYTDWLLSQTWFAERFQSLYTVIINNFQEPSETPEHNAMQVKFLQKEYRERIAACYCGQYDKVLSVGDPSFEEEGFDVRFTANILDGLSPEKRQKLEKRERFLKEVNDQASEEMERQASYHPPSWESGDVEGRKVYEKAEHEERERKNREIERLRKSFGGEESTWGWKFIDTMNDVRKELAEIAATFKHGGTPRVRLDFFCELKPALSDNFPAVLRQIKDAKSRAKGSFGEPHFLLIAGSYTGKGAELKDVIKVFKSSGIDLFLAQKPPEVERIEKNECGEA